MAVKTQTIALSTQGNADIIDITGRIHQALQETGLRSGVLTVFCPSSTSALTTIEYESGCLTDFRRLFNEILDPRRTYAHNARWGDANGHSHLRAALLGPSISVPFIDQQLTLGTWQQIVYIDFDIHPRSRELVVQAIGE